MKDLKLLLSNYKVTIVVFFIILIALIFRFANYSNRWTLNQDQARDALIAIYSIQHKTLPLIGPPSSAGSFSFGPFYYWLIIFFSLILPFSVSGPWIGFTLLSLATVFFFFYLGKKYGGNKLAIILGVITSFSSAQVFNAPDMLNPLPVFLFTVLSFFSLIRLIEFKKIKYAYFLGLFVGIAINFHFQALGLLTLLVLSVFINGFKIKQKFLILLGNLAGLLTSFLPFLYFNFQKGNVLVNHFITYLKVGQNNFGIHNLWKEDLLNFWPKLWGSVLVDIPIAGYLFVIVILIALIFSFKSKRDFKNSFKIIFLSFILQIIALRYYSGPRLPLYLIVFHPYIIFLTGWSIWVLDRFSRYISIALLIIFLGLATYSNLKIIQTPSQTPLILSIKQRIDLENKGQINLLTEKDSEKISLPLFYLLLKQDRISDNGYKIGSCDNVIIKDSEGMDLRWSCPNIEEQFIRENSYSLYDLNNLREEKISDLNFKSISQRKLFENLYDNY